MLKKNYWKRMKLLLIICLLIYKHKYLFENFFTYNRDRLRNFYLFPLRDHLLRKINIQINVFYNYKEFIEIFFKLLN